VRQEPQPGHGLDAGGPAPLQLRAAADVAGGVRQRLRTEILLISRKSPNERERWIYLDAGLYSGLDETLGERIHYRIRTQRDGGACGPVILAGSTCDGTDILYAKSRYELPLGLEIGDRIDFLSAGA
jgi:ornithine decarboxylase